VTKNVDEKVYALAEQWLATEPSEARSIEAEAKIWTLAKVIQRAIDEHLEDEAREAVTR